MAADDLSAPKLPPVTWPGDLSSRDTSHNTSERGREVRGRKGSEKVKPREIDFEPIEHELDSIA